MSKINYVKVDMINEGMGGWKPKARAVVCGNCEEDSAGKGVANKAEVPKTCVFSSHTIKSKNGIFNHSN